jgi:hypothetical protein
VKKLLQLVEQIGALDEDDVIFARPEFSADSDAATYPLTADDRVPEEPKKLGLHYFLEVSIAREVLEGLTSGKSSMTLREQCERLIQYAINDA